MSRLTMSNRSAQTTYPQQHRWQFAVSLDEIEQKQSLMTRVLGKQIAIFRTRQGILACDNRCPHEGYPLSEGDLADTCTLTCNWHNWKFNLKTGENLYGGDRLRIYPVEIRGQEVWVDLKEPPYEERYQTIMNNLKDAFEDHEYDRIARELARLKKIGADPLDAVRQAIAWSWDRMEFGWTHAYAGTADWLTLFDRHAGNREYQLVCLLESIGHMAFDVLREQRYPFPIACKKFEEDIFLTAMESEDESTAVACVLGGLNTGLGFKDMERAFTYAALEHYNDFGHSLIYVNKTKQLIDRLGPEITQPILLSLVREIIYATREDRIPEFRNYHSALEKWGTGKSQNPEAHMWLGLGINQALDKVIEFSSEKPELIYRALLIANAVNFLNFDISQQQKIRITVSGNVGWLDFTHGLTFANAVRKQCTAFAQTWPKGLLQMACFSGRNAAFTTAGLDLQKELDCWCADSPDNMMQQLMDKVMDHGQDEYIVSVHLLKTAMAVAEEIQHLSEYEGRILVAALNRFFNSPLKRKQTHRTAYQSLKFVDKE